MSTQQSTRDSSYSRKIIEDNFKFLKILKDRKESQLFLSKNYEHCMSISSDLSSHTGSKG